MIRLRAATSDDAETATAVVIAADIAELGVADYAIEDLRDEWAAPGFELARDAAIAEDDHGRAVGYAAFRGERAVLATTADAADAPLLDWCEARGAERGVARHQQAVAECNARRRALLEARGYVYVRSYHRMQRVLTSHEPEPEIPAGIALRALDPVADGPALHDVDVAAFPAVPDYEPQSLAVFTREHLATHNLDPALSRVAHTQPEERAAGFALVRGWPDEQAAYVDLLAVHPAHAGRGLGTALLRSVFAAAAARGHTTVQLGMASDNTPAGRLYERAGMTSRWRYDAYDLPR